MWFPAAIESLIWVVSVAALALGVYYDRRSGVAQRAGARLAAHHCTRCGHIYTAPRGEGRHPCPVCSQPNPRLKY